MVQYLQWYVDILHYVHPIPLFLHIGNRDYHTGGVRKRFIFVSGKSLVNPIILTSLPLVPLIFRDDSFSRLDDWNRARRCRRVHRDAVVTREGESRVLGKESRARGRQGARRE